MYQFSKKIALVISLVGASFFAGCGVTSTTLPSNLQPGGGGALSITTTQFPDAISGRTYYLILSTSGGSGALSSCVVTSGKLPTGLGWQISSANPADCILTGAVTGAAGTYPVVVQATDTSSSPKTDSLQYNLVVRNDFSICSGPASLLPAPYSTSCSASSTSATTTALPDAVQGRSYGIAPLSETIVTNLNLTGDSSPVNHPNESGNGPLVASSAVTTLPQGIGSAAGAGVFTLSGADVTGSPATFTVTVTITDSAITIPTQTQPVVPPRTYVKTYSLIVHTPLQLAQSLGSSWPDAVSGRPYGSGTGCSGGACIVPTFTVTTGTGLGTYVWPATTPASVAAITGMNCPAVAQGTTTYTCSAATVTAAPTTPGAAPVAYSPSVAVSDAGNTATPPGNTTTDPGSVVTATVNVDAPLSLTFDATLSSSASTNFAQGVIGRDYGISTDTCANAAPCKPIVYEVKTGLGTYTVSAGTTFPTGFNHVESTNNRNFDVTSSFSADPESGAVGTYSPSVTVDDTANTTTPDAASSSTTPVAVSGKLVISGAINVTPPASPFPSAVLGRHYGVSTDTCSPGPNCAPLTYTVPVTAGGLGAPYTFTPNNFPPGFTCTANANVGSCFNSTGVGGAAGTLTNLNVTVADSPNAAVPGSSAAASGNATMTVLPEMTLTAPANPFPPAVVGRHYGVTTDACSPGPNCSPLVYSVPAATPGLGGYTFTPNGYPTGFVCVTSAINANCSDPTGVGGPPGTITSLNVTVQDTANTSTPHGSVTSTNGSLLVNAEMTITPPASPFPPAVVARHYGVAADTCNPGNCAPLTYTIPPATPGLGGYTFTPNNFPAGFACATSTNTGNCSDAAGIGGAPGTLSTLNVTVQDTANSSTPSNSVTSVNGSMVVNAEMTLTPPISPFATAVVGRHYGVSTDTCSPGPNCSPLTYTVPASTPGLGGYSFTPNNFPTGFSCTASTSSASCSDSTGVGGPAGTLSNLNVTVKDTANTSTPQGSVNSANSAMTVDAEMVLTAPTSPFPNAVVGRHYGVTADTCLPGPNCSPLVYTVAPATPGLGGPYTFTPNNYPTGFTCATSTNNADCSDSAGVGGPAGTLSNLTVTAQDTANASTPAGSVNSTAGTLTVNAELTISPPTSPFAPAVVGRHYGLATDACNPGNCAPLVYTVPITTPGLGGYTFTANNFPTGFACTTSTNTGNCADGTGVGGPAGTVTTLNVTVHDTANSTTPSNSVTSTNGSLTVEPEMTITPPVSPFATAVVGRHYGVSTDTCSAGSCAPLVYTVPTATPGLGGYSFAPNNFPGGFACATSANSSSCSDNAGVGGSAGTFGNLTVTVKDTANTSTPQGTVTSTTGSLTVDAEMTLTPPSSPFPGAVLGRHYGVSTDTCNPGNCTPLVYTVPPASSGLGGPYTFTANNFPAGFTCVTSTNTGSCSDPAGVGGAAGTLATLNVTVKDTANTSTPQGSVNSTNGSLTVNAEMTVTLPSSFPAAVVGRHYGVAGDTCGAVGCAPLTYTIPPTAPGLGGYTFTPNNFPSGFACTTSTNTGNCSDSTAVGGAPGTLSTLNVTVVDTANTATPHGSVTSASGSLVVDAEMTITPPVSPFVPAVVGRHYGVSTDTCNPGSCAPLVYTVPAATPGLGGYSFTPNNFPTGFACTTSTNIGDCFDNTAVGGSAGALTTLNVTVHDTANASTPRGTVTSTNGSLTVDAEMVVTPPGSFPAAVVGRHYGVSTDTCSPGPSCAPLTYTISVATAGLGGPYTFTPNNFPSGFTCTTSTNSGLCSDPTAVGGPAGTLNTITVTAKDTANASTPQGSVNSAAGALTVDAEMVVTLPSSFPPAVVGRHYGVTTDACTPGPNCAPLAYTISASTPGLGGYTFTPNNFPSGFTCTTSTNTGNCSDSTAVGGPAGTLSTVNVSVVDTANAATPHGSINSSNGSLVVDAEMTITPPAGPLAAAVVGRHYGVSTDTCSPGPNCAPIVYTVPTAAPGLGGYVFTPNNFPTGFACTTTTNTGNCSDSTGVGGPTGTLTTLNASVRDTANAATPHGSVTSTNSSLTVDAEMALTPPTSPFPPAVVGRHYGVSTDTCSPGPNCAPLVYTVPVATAGLGAPYTFATNNFPTGFTCTASTNTGTCDDPTAVGGSAGTLTTLNVNVKDTANASTPQGSVNSSNGTMVVDAEMTVTLPSSFPAAVVGRHYGVSTDTCTPGPNCAPLTYTIPASAPGLGGPYTFTPNNFPTGFACTTSTNTGNCSDGTAVGGPAGTLSNVSVTVVDAAGVATPHGSVTSANGSLVVDAEMTITPPTSPFPNGVLGRHYGVPTDTCVPGPNCAPLAYTVPTTTPGLGGYTFTPNNFPTGFTCTTSTNTGNCSDGAGIGGSATTISNMNVTVADTANAATPHSSVTSTNGSLTVVSALAISSNLTSPFPDAAIHRDYGVATDMLCTSAGNVACATLSYTATGGLLNGSNGYASIVANGTSATAPGASFPLGFTCTGNSPLTTATCSAAPISNTVTAGVYTPAALVTDTANASTPAGTQSSALGSLTVDSDVTVAVTIGGVGFSASTTWPDGVVGRPYGSGTCAGGTPCVEPTFTASQGLGGPYTFSNESSLTTVGFVCTPSTPALTCSDTDLTAAFTPSVTVSDTANSTTPAATSTSDASSVFTSTVAEPLNPELQIATAFLENATVGEPYSAVFTVTTADIGEGGPYKWCVGTIANAACPGAPTGGITGVTFVTPSPAISDDPPVSGLTNRGYYQGTPTAVQSSASTATTFQVSDLGSSVVPGCSYIGPPSTCPSFTLTSTNAPKVLDSQGFVANSFSESLLPFEAVSPFGQGTSVDLSASTQEPITPRVTPDGGWIYVAQQSKISIVDSQLDAKAVSDISFTTTGTSASSPTQLEIEPQQYFTANPTACAAHCSNLNPFIRYDAWLLDWAATANVPTTSANIQPIPEAENPGAVPTALPAGNATTVANGYGIGITPDATQAWVSQDPSCSGNPASACNTMAWLTLPALSGTAATTYPAGAPTELALGLNGGPMAVDPRGNYMYSVQYNHLGLSAYIAINSTGASDPPLSTPNAFLGNLPSSATYGGFTHVCGSGGTPSAMTVSTDGNRLLVVCQEEPNDYIESWDVSQSDGVLAGSDGSLASPVVTIVLPVSAGSTGGFPANAENGCDGPVDIKAKATSSAYGMRLFVSCHESDTIVPIDYNSGSGTNTLDSVQFGTEFSTDAAPIANNATTYAAACAQAGSTCPYGLSLMPNPALHFITGGFAPSASPSAMAAAHKAVQYFQYVVIAGGARPMTWTNPDGVLSSDPNCSGLILSSTTGEIYGLAANVTATCGGTNGFIIRATDGAGQFVERAFTIPIS